MYYSLINKVGTKASIAGSSAELTINAFTSAVEELEDENCEACKL
jgi:hypothetical protein